MHRYATDDYELTNWLLSHGADPNASCGLNKTPLSAAVQYSPLEVIKLLFARGGSVKQGRHNSILRAVRYMIPRNVLLSSYGEDNTDISLIPIAFQVNFSITLSGVSRMTAQLSSSTSCSKVQK